mgnify:CR=1 FL=1
MCKTCCSLNTKVDNQFRDGDGNIILTPTPLGVADTQTPAYADTYTITYSYGAQNTPIALNSTPTPTWTGFVMTAKAEKGDDLPDPVAEVNGAPVTADEFREALKRYERPGLNIPGERLSRIKKSLLNRLVDDKLIEHAIKKDKVEVDRQKLEEDFTKYFGVRSQI